MQHTLTPLPVRTGHILGSMNPRARRLIVSGVLVGLLLVVVAVALYHRVG